jgi:hypothetical protein
MPILTEKAQRIKDHKTIVWRRQMARRQWKSSEVFDNSAAAMRAIRARKVNARGEMQR